MNDHAPGTSSPAPAPAVPPSTSFDVTLFGAIGDGQADDTAAIQHTIDLAAEAGGGAVWFPPGAYACSTLRVPSYVGLFGHPTWSYHQPGGTYLQLNDENADCLIDLTGSHGARVVGLALEGGKLGEDVIGIYINGENHKQEDTLFIENCRIARFTGDGVRLDHVWGYTVRNNMIIFNGGDGLSLTRWDGWIYQNIFNNNAGYGIHARRPNGAMSIVANRIEWNHTGGLYVHSGGGHHHINGNYFDRSGGPAIHLAGTADRPVDTISITGNIIHRSGARVDLESDQCCHLLLEHCQGVVCTGNAFHAGANDSGQGQNSPTTGLVLDSLEASIIRNNVMYCAVVRELMLDRGGHDEQTIIADNIGCPAKSP
ncbi:MAG: right-handed parallel beta-helix repeat-containing protein [bacterium]